MHVTMSVVLPDDLLQAMEPYVVKFHNRSELIECALRTFLAQLAKQERDVQELHLLNQYADELNQEALDVLEYQVPL